MLVMVETILRCSTESTVSGPEQEMNYIKHIRRNLEHTRDFNGERLSRRNGDREDGECHESSSKRL
jgi:hypothetical protein